jgi:GDPmannose 4,6-dehydratase
VKINQKFYRPSEVDLLIGDPTKAEKILDWYPKTSLESLCEMMVKKDLDRNKNGLSY